MNEYISQRLLIITTTLDDLVGELQMICQIRQTLPLYGILLTHLICMHVSYHFWMEVIFSLIHYVQTSENTSVMA